MPEMTSIKDLLTDEIKDLYSAEQQLTKALPKMVKGRKQRQLERGLNLTSGRDGGASKPASGSSYNARNFSHRQEVQRHGRRD